MNSFEAGYSYFEKQSGVYASALASETYVAGVQKEIDCLRDYLNSFNGFKTPTAALKGDVFEFWHAGTFNIDSAVKSQKSRVTVDRSHDLASPDITSNFGKAFGLKAYNTGKDSAVQQAKSIFERYKNYQAQGGKASLEEYLAARGIKNPQSVLNNPIYQGQIRIIPKGQMQEAIEWLENKINKESTIRPEQVARYKETLQLLRDKIEDGKGTTSIAVSKEEIEQITNLAKEGKISEDIFRKLGLSTESLIEFKYIFQQSLTAGVSAAVISAVLKIVPELYKAIAYLIENGEVDPDSFKRIGVAAFEGSTEGFFKGCISAAITTACKAGMLGDALKSVNPAVVGAVTVLTFDTMKNAYLVSKGKMQRADLVDDLIKELFVSTCSLVGGGITQAFIHVPVLGYLVGSFLGSIVGAFAYHGTYQAILSICVDTGFSVFGLVEQDYQIPEEVLKEEGLDVFEPAAWSFDEFYPDSFCLDDFTFEEFQPDGLDIQFLKRGVIGVRKIGYIIDE